MCKEASKINKLGGFGQPLVFNESPKAIEYYRYVCCQERSFKDALARADAAFSKIKDIFEKTKSRTKV